MYLLYEILLEVEGSPRFVRVSGEESKYPTLK